MSMVTVLTSAFQRVGLEFKAIRTLISGSPTGDVSALTTTATNLVAAINEVRGQVVAQPQINDSTTATNSLWSSSKTNTEIQAAVTAVVNSSPAALDTLSELATALGNDANFAASTATALGNRVRFDAVQSLTAPQQLQARQNIDAASVTALGVDYETHDFTADFVAALV